MTTPSKIQKARQAFNDAMTNLTAVRGEYRAAHDDVRNDQDLTDAAKARKVTELHEHFVTEVGARQEAAALAMADYIAALDHTANPPIADGIEGVAARIEAADARSRIRGMIAAGTDPNKILIRAAELGDLNALDALKSETAWLDGAGKGIAEAIDRARADAIGGERGDAIREAITFESQRQAWTDKILRAPSELAAGPTLATAVSDHYSGIATPIEGAGDGPGEAA